MSNNMYMDAFVQWFRKQDDDPGVDVELVAALALIKELQTLNETLNKVIYRNNEGDWFINTEALPSYED